MYLTSDGLNLPKFKVVRNYVPNVQGKFATEDSADACASARTDRTNKMPLLQLWWPRKYNDIVLLAYHTMATVTTAETMDGGLGRATLHKMQFTARDELWYLDWHHTQDFCRCTMYMFRPTQFLVSGGP